MFNSAFSSSDKSHGLYFQRQFFGWSAMFCRSSLGFTTLSAMFSLLKPSSASVKSSDPNDNFSYSRRYVLPFKSWLHDFVSCVFRAKTEFDFSKIKSSDPNANISSSRRYVLLFKSWLHDLVSYFQSARIDLGLSKIFRFQRQFFVFSAMFWWSSLSFLTWLAIQSSKILRSAPGWAS